MKVKSISLIICAILISMFFIGCDSDEPIVPEVTVSSGTVDYFSEAMDFPSTGGAKILNFTSNVDWKISASSTQGGETWCRVSQSEGTAGTYGIAIIVDENNGYDDRNIVLVLEAGNITKSLVVNQKQKNSITLTTNRFEIDSKGGTINVEVKSNVDYKIDIPEECQDWITQISGTRAMSTTNLSFNIAKSKEYDKREGMIIISSGELNETIKVYQSGSSILVLSQNEFTLGSEGGSVSIDISSNFQYEVDMPNVDWIKSVSNTRAVSSHTLKYDISENTTYDDREAIIVFKDANGDKKESVTIKQRQKDAILLSSKKVEISQNGGTFSVDVNSNVDYSIEISSTCSDWISRTTTANTRAVVKTTPSFKVESSDQYDKREGEIYFKYQDIADTLRVYQSGGAILVLSKSNYSLEGEATTISVELKSNIEYKVKPSVDWITEISTRALSSSTKVFNIETNKTGKSRTGNITFTTSDGSKTATVNVTQATVVEAKSLNISFTNTSGTIGGNLYIGKNYKFSVSVTPSNAVTDCEWKVEDSNIASISGNGRNATLTTKNFGHTKVIVTDKNTGLSASYDISTAVTDFEFTESSRETQYGYPVITIAIDGSHQLKYKCYPSYATKIFSNLKAFNFKEINSSINTYAIVEKSSIVDIDENGLMTAKKIGTTIINANNSNGVCKSGYNDGIFVKVVKEISPYGTIGGHGYVDLGLPSGKLWSTTNFGGWSETDYGSYYMWSSTDRVPTSWGNKWSTPTRAEFNELLNYCSYKWTTKDGVNGYLFTGKNGATMFLPAAGFKSYIEGYGYSSVQSGGKFVLYWTSDNSSYSWEGQNFAYALQGSSGSLDSNSTYNTTIVAAPIRPISR